MPSVALATCAAGEWVHGAGLSFSLALAGTGARAAAAAGVKVNASTRLARLELPRLSAAVKPAVAAVAVVVRRLFSLDSFSLVSFLLGEIFVLTIVGIGAVAMATLRSELLRFPRWPVALILFRLLSSSSLLCMLSSFTAVCFLEFLTLILILLLLLEGFWREPAALDGL